MSADLASIARLLEASLDPRQARQAEQQLRQGENAPGFSVALLHIVASSAYEDGARLAAAIFFKNFVTRNWTDELGNHKLPQNEVTTIKTELISLMISVPPNLQSQLGEAVSKIADSDFWDKWDTLVKDLVSRITANDAKVNNGVLQVAHSIFKRWRPLIRSDELFTEINHVLADFSDPFLALIKNTFTNIEQSRDKKDALQQHISTMILVIKLFYDLSCQDLPPRFEESLPDLCQLLLSLLTYDNPLLHSDDDSESGPLEYLRAAIFEALTLYAEKYAEEFAPHLGQFMDTSWHLLTNIGPQPRYDVLVSKALQFLTKVVINKANAESFNNQDTLSQVVERVILPSVEVRESDTEMFEDEPIEFIRRDLEGSEGESRRRAATDLLRQLLPHFETLVTSVVLRYVEHYLAQYTADPANNWKAKDTAVYLFSAIAAKGVPTLARGVVSTNPNVDVLGFFQNNIAADLTSTTAQPLLKVDAIKYLHRFRSQLSKAQWQAAFPLLVDAMDSTNYAVYTYAAITIERVLYMTDDQRNPYLEQHMVQSAAEALLRRLFKLIAKDSKPEKIQENEYLAKCVMRVLFVIRAGVVPMLDMVLQNLINITKVIRHNPSGPVFYYYHFESYGAAIRFAAPTNAAQVEQAVLQTFAEILQSEILEFQPYVLQLFALLLETSPADKVSEHYLSLLPFTLNIEMYNTRSNVPALVRVLNALIPRAAEQIAAKNQIEMILRIFQRLILSKANESHGFDLIETVIDNLPVTALQPYFATVLQLMFTRLSESKTENFVQRFVRFYHFFSSRDGRGLGADQFVGIADQVQKDVFTPIYLTIILPDTQKLVRPYDRKIAVVSLSHTLATSEAFANRYGNKGWGLTCEALLRLLINPPLPPSRDDATAIEERDPDDITFNVGFTALSTCKATARDPFPEVQDVKSWLGGYLKEQDVATSGRISTFVQQKLSDDAKAALKGIMS